MDELKTVKALLTGMFNQNYDYDFESVDDSYFLQIIKVGMEKTKEVDPGFFDELLEHVIEEYTQIWLRMAEEEGEIDEKLEREDARKNFLKFFHGEEF